MIVSRLEGVVGARPQRVKTPNFPDRHATLVAVQHSPTTITPPEKENVMTTIETLSVVLAVYGVVFLAHRATSTSERG
jgi:hypothetical protein